MIELASDSARENKKTRKIPQHIQQAVKNDKELMKLLDGVTMAMAIVMAVHHGCNGSLLPNIYAAFMPKKKDGKE